MAWSRDRVDSSNINNGNEYQKGDRVSRQQLNAMVNAGLYSQDFVEALTETPVVNNEEVNANPTVNLIPYEKNGKEFYKFEFNNIKGKTGETGPAGADGADGTNGADGESAIISSATAEISNENTTTPSVEVQLGGTSLDRTFHFVFKGILGGGGSGGSNVTLYETTGQNTDGAMTQKATTDELNKKVEFEDFNTLEYTPSIQTQIDSIQNQLSSTQNEVNNKADKNLNNVPSIFPYVGAVSGGVDFVVETYINPAKTYWYRKYKSGWLECGGTVATNNQISEGVTVTFPDPFSHLLNLIINSGLGWDANSQAVVSPKIISWSNTSFTFYTTFANANQAGYPVSKKFHWRAEGFV